MLLRLQATADTQARSARRAKLALENGRPVGPVLNKTASSSKEPRSAPKFRSILAEDLPIDENRHIALDDVVTRTKQTEISVKRLNEDLDLIKVRIRSEIKEPETLLPIAPSKNQQYFKAVLKDLLENDTLDAANKKYLSGSKPPPMLEANLATAQRPASLSKLNKKRSEKKLEHSGASSLKR